MDLEPNAALSSMHLSNPLWKPSWLEALKFHSLALQRAYFLFNRLISCPPLPPRLPRVLSTSEPRMLKVNPIYTGGGLHMTASHLGPLLLLHFPGSAMRANKSHIPGAHLRLILPPCFTKPWHQGRIGKALDSRCWEGVCVCCYFSYNNVWDANSILSQNTFSFKRAAPGGQPVIEMGIRLLQHFRLKAFKTPVWFM